MKSSDLIKHQDEFSSEKLQTINYIEQSQENFFRFNFDCFYLNVTNSGQMVRLSSSNFVGQFLGQMKLLLISSWHEVPFSPGIN